MAAIVQTLDAADGAVAHSSHRGPGAKTIAISSAGPAAGAPSNTECLDTGVFNMVAERGAPETEDETKDESILHDLANGTNDQTENDGIVVGSDVSSDWIDALLEQKMFYLEKQIETALDSLSGNIMERLGAPALHRDPAC